MEFEFLVTNTPEGWRGWRGDNLEVDAAGIRIKKDPVSTYVSPELVFSLEEMGFTGRSDFSDIALDGCGILYLLDSLRGEIYRYDPRQDRLERLCCFAGISREDGGSGNNMEDREEGRPLEFRDPGGIWVTDDSIYIADTGNRKLHSISKHLLQTRWMLDGEVFEEPADIVVDGHENIYVMDTGIGVIVKVTKEGEVSEVIGESYLNNPLDIAIDDSQNLYVLDEADGEYRIWRFVLEGGRYISKDVQPWIGPEKFQDRDGVDINPSCIAAGSGDELFVGEAYDRENGSEKKLLRYLLEEGAFARILSYRGSAHKLVMDSMKNLYLITGDKKKVYFLKYTRKNRFNEKTSLYSGDAVRRFDSGRDDTYWHRIKLDFVFPAHGTQVQVSYFATNNKDIGEEDVHWSTPPLANPGDALLDGGDIKGRYLWMKITLIGTEYDSPGVRSVRVYFPRMSYLRYLPAIYQEDGPSKEFLERFLSLFESFFVDIEEEIDGITKYFDPQGVPARYLSWLGSWLAIEADETWTESRKRELIKKAPALYKMRGTREGLMEILKLYVEGKEYGGDDMAAEPPTSWCEAHLREGKALDRLVEKGYITKEDRKREMAEYRNLMVERMERAGELFDIFEYFKLMSIEDKELREIYRKLIGCPRCFLVLVNPLSLRDEELRTVKRIVDSQAPAHTVGRVVELRPSIYLDGHTYLGINTVLSRRRFVLEKSGLGKDSVLTEREEYGHLDVKSRIGVDTVIS